MDVTADTEPGLVTPSEYLYPIPNASAWEKQNPSYSSVHVLLVASNMLSKWNETVHRVFPMKICQLNQGSGRVFVLAISPHALFKPGHKKSRHHTLSLHIFVNRQQNSCKLLPGKHALFTLYIYSGPLSGRLFNNISQSCSVNFKSNKYLHGYHYESFLTHLKWLWGGSGQKDEGAIKDVLGAFTTKSGSEGSIESNFYHAVNELFLGI